MCVCLCLVVSVSCRRTAGSSLYLLLGVSMLFTPACHILVFLDDIYLTREVDYQTFNIGKAHQNTIMVVLLPVYIKVLL